MHHLLAAQGVNLFGHFSPLPIPIFAAALQLSHVRFCHGELRNVGSQGCVRLAVGGLSVAEVGDERFVVGFAFGYFEAADHRSAIYWRRNASDDIPTRSRDRCTCRHLCSTTSFFVKFSLVPVGALWHMAIDGGFWVDRSQQIALIYTGMNVI